MNDCNEMDTGTRSTISLTLLLSAVAFKVSLASSLPQVPYFTFLDSIMWVLISFISLLAVENIAWPAASCTNPSMNLRHSDELYVMYGLLLLLIFSVGIMCVIAWRIIKANERTVSSQYCSSSEYTSAALSTAVGRSAKVHAS